MALLRKHLFSNIVRHPRHYSVFNENLNKSIYFKCLCPAISVPKRCLFWEKDRKGGYQTEIKVPRIELIKQGFKELKNEIKLWKEEMKELIVTDPILVARPDNLEDVQGITEIKNVVETIINLDQKSLTKTQTEYLEEISSLTGETDLIWCFNHPSVLDNFVTTADSDHNEGYSRCGLEMSRAGRARFHGYLDTRVPKDGKIKRAGYCALRSKRVRKSFKRHTTFNWNIYNTLVLKIRGDGRSYLLNISCEGYYDITWNDIYHYVLFTRGGPYWQIAKIPFSKFVFGSKGRVQDKQTRMRFDKVTHFGISAGDKINGVFDLEIEYIGLEFDPTHEEEFAYEMYKTDKHIVAV